MVTYVVSAQGILPIVFTYVTYSASARACGLGSMPVWAVQRFDEMLLDELQANVFTRTAWLSTREKGQ